MRGVGINVGQDADFQIVIISPREDFESVGASGFWNLKGRNAIGVGFTLLDAGAGGVIDMELCKGDWNGIASCDHIGQSVGRAAGSEAQAAIKELCRKCDSDGLGGIHFGGFAVIGRLRRGGGIG